MASSSDLQLVLGLGSDTIYNITTPKKPCSNLTVTSGVCEPSLTLALSAGNTNNNHYLLPKKIDVNIKASNCEENTALDHLSRQTSSPHSVVSSFSGGRVKRERDLSSSEMEAEAERLSSRISDEDYEDGTNARKKLRLTKEQSALLEESFKQHSTLNPKQKQALARQLNLRPRQVEVWFQNRRARTKLKQTEVDCEFLKKCCETLTDENRRLQKEVQELKALKISSHQPLYVPMPAATLTMCPSCERLGGVDGGGSNAIINNNNNNNNNNKMSFSMTPKATHHHLFNPFTNPSAAC